MPDDASDLNILAAIEKATQAIQQLSINVSLCTMAIANFDSRVRELLDEMEDDRTRD